MEKAIGKEKPGKGDKREKKIRENKKIRIKKLELLRKGNEGRPKETRKRKKNGTDEEKRKIKRIERQRLNGETLSYLPASNSWWIQAVCILCV